MNTDNSGDFPIGVHLRSSAARFLGRFSGSRLGHARNLLNRIGTGFGLLCAVVALVGVGLVAYSQTAAFAWDEGFHLLAAQLILAGKKPYLDFVFSQTPLNAYWNAAWMWIFGQSWRTAHAVAALATTAAVGLVADFVYRRLAMERSRVAAAVTAAAAMGLNVLVAGYGTIGQAYGLCLLLIVAAFRCALAAVERRGRGWAALAGLAAGGAAASSLLTAPVAVVLLAWIAYYDRAGRRLAKGIAFVAGAAAAFLPLAGLFAASPRNVWFGIFEYNFLYRGVMWETATRHNFAVMISWIDSFDALFLSALAAAGLWFAVRQSGWERARRAEFLLCGWLALGLGVHISTARPTFAQYYLFLVPFLSILAATGLYAVTSRLFPDSQRGWVAALLAVALLAIAEGKALYDGRNDFTWGDLEEVARAVDRVTPPHALLLADEQVYFLTRRAPPEGMALKDSHKIEFPGPLERRLHLVGWTELDRRTRAAEFDVVQACDEEERTEELGLERLYRQKAEFDNQCLVFWERARQ